jgi:hypothetical protein
MAAATRACWCGIAVLDVFVLSRRLVFLLDGIHWLDGARATALIDIGLATPVRCFGSAPGSCRIPTDSAPPR